MQTYIFRTQFHMDQQLGLQPLPQPLMVLCLSLGATEPSLPLTHYITTVSQSFFTFRFLICEIGESTQTQSSCGVYMKMCEKLAHDKCQFFALLPLSYLSLWPMAPLMGVELCMSVFRALGQQLLITKVKSEFLILMTLRRVLRGVLSLRSGGILGNDSFLYHSLLST